MQMCKYAIWKYANIETNVRFNQNVIRCFPDRRSQARHGREVLENYWNPAQKEIRGLVINRRTPLPLSHHIRLVSTSAGNFPLVGCHVVLLSYCVLVRKFVIGNVWNGNVAEFGPLWHFEINKQRRQLVLCQSHVKPMLKNYFANILLFQRAFGNIKLI